MKEATVEQLRTLLTRGETTSVELIERYWKAIQTHEPSLNAFIDLNHEAFSEARALDIERHTTGVRSPLHGIPVVIKDNILSAGSMRTTVNSRVFKDFFAPFDAHLVTRLREAGAIILGKTTLSEFAYYMSKTTMPSGYGSLSGQTVSAYDKTLDPLGSSTGSAVAVSADMAPIGIGTETNGSLMSPAINNSLVSLKPTVGLVSRHGIFPISSSQDTAGPLSKTVACSAALLDVIAGYDPADAASLQKSATSYEEALSRDLHGMRVGALVFKDHTLSDAQITAFDEAKAVLREAGAEIVKIEHTYDIPNNTHILSPEMNRDMNRFLSALPNAPVKTFRELTQANRSESHLNLKHAQGLFLDALGSDMRLKDARYLDAKLKTKAAVDGFNALYGAHGVDVIISPHYQPYAAVGGTPSMVVPASSLLKGSPLSIMFAAPALQEFPLIKVAYAYEQGTKHRRPPKLL